MNRIDFDSNTIIVTDVGDNSSLMFEEVHQLTDHYMPRISTAVMLAELEKRAIEFVGRDDLNVALRHVAERIVAECVAAKMAGGD